MTKEVLFPLFSDWKKRYKSEYSNINGKELWKLFVKNLEKYNIINIWKVDYNENEIRKQLDLPHLDDEGWYVSGPFRTKQINLRKEK